ncbi:MAG: tetratricopeptide repeat protein, partial [Lentisphaerota bacterium]
PEKASTIYQQIIDTHPESDLAAWSLLGLSRLKHLVPVGQDPDYSAVMKAYDGVIARYPQHLAAKEAFIYKMAVLISTLQEKETRQALAELEKFVQNPSQEFVGPAYSLIAVGYTTLNQPEKRLEAEEHSLATTEVDPTNPFTEFTWQYWNVATIAEFELGDFATARKYYNKLIAEYPQDIRIYGAKQALKRMDNLEAQLRAEAGVKAEATP